tara:strand:- start:456 stop:686 length:231 start_codon:yes stop_codon:yes gene_type:complete
MTPHLKSSIVAAERDLPADGQEALAQIIESFTQNFCRDALADFTEDEWKLLRIIAAEPFEEADPSAVMTIFAKHGL